MSPRSSRRFPLEPSASPSASPDPDPSIASEALRLLEYDPSRGIAREGRAGAESITWNVSYRERPSEGSPIDTSSRRITSRMIWPAIWPASQDMQLGRHLALGASRLTLHPCTPVPPALTLISRSCSRANLIVLRSSSAHPGPAIPLCIGPPLHSLADVLCIPGLHEGESLWFDSSIEDGHPAAEPATRSVHVPISLIPSLIVERVAAATALTPDPP
jgi:hypothetical protein